MLSGQEHRVAHLVAQGLTNQEVAQELYISTKTVEYHLTNIFTKLDIASRRQLRSLVTAGESAGEAAPGLTALAVAGAHASERPASVTIRGDFTALTASGAGPGVRAARRTARSP